MGKVRCDKALGWRGQVDVISSEPARRSGEDVKATGHCKRFRVCFRLKQVTRVLDPFVFSGSPNPGPNSKQITRVLDPFVLSGSPESRPNSKQQTIVLDPFVLNGSPNPRPNSKQITTVFNPFLLSGFPNSGRIPSN